MKWVEMTELAAGEVSYDHDCCFVRILSGHLLLELDDSHLPWRLKTFEKLLAFPPQISSGHSLALSPEGTHTLVDLLDCLGSWLPRVCSDIEASASSLYSLQYPQAHFLFNNGVFYRRQFYFGDA
jgi:hypothetical protein